MKYRIDLQDYDVPFERWEVGDGGKKLVVGEEPLDVKQEFYNILRLPGVYKNGIETCDGVDLANRIKTTTELFIDIESNELELIKRIFDQLITQEHKPQVGQASMGGDRYIPLIQRVFKATEVV